MKIRSPVLGLSLAWLEGRQRTIECPLRRLARGSCYLKEFLVIAVVSLLVVQLPPALIVLPVLLKLLKIGKRG